MLYLLPLLGWTSPSFAQEGEMLALPATPDPAFVPPPVPVDPAAVDRFDALYQYRTRSLQVRGYRFFSGGGGTVVHTGWGWGRYGGPYWGLGSSYVLVDPLIAHDSWAVFQGAQRMTVPAYLEVVGDPTAPAVAGRIRRSRTSSQGLLGLGVGGAVAALVGGIGSQTAPTYPESRNWAVVSNVGLVSLAVGVIGSGIASSQARNLRYEFPSTQDYGQTAQQVEAYNARLREELRLTKRDVRAEGAR